VLEVNPEDQYAIASGDVTLSDLEAALPEGLQFRAPKLGLTLEDWLLSGGVGLLNAAPIRSDVLGLTYTGAHGSVSIGGVVVKNVSGYDLRFVIGSDPSLQRPVRLERAVLRLRPSVKVMRLEQSVSESQLESSLASLQRLGAAYGFGYPFEGAWRVRAEFRGNAPHWGEPASSAVPVMGLRDAMGAFPRATRVLTDLERAVLGAL
jgi:hypothetical protein